MQNAKKDFFISYNKADRAWAEWVAWQLEAAEYTTVIQAWDFHPGSNFVLDMHQAASTTYRTIAILSSAYLAAFYTQPEWAAAFVQDPTGQQGTLLPIRVQECSLTGLLTALVYIDLVDLDEAAAAKALLAGIGRQRSKPSSMPAFPKSGSPSQSPSPRFPGALPPVWNVPYRRNRFFTGREELLKQLRDNLTRTKAAALTQAQAISGLGGIGKTQTAVEYAYRYRDEYQAVLWVNAATRDTLIASCVEVANLLDLAEKQEQDQNKLVVAVRRWLDQHDQWLLIFDNADDLDLADAFLPMGGSGHLLLTTRAQAAGTIANSLEVEKMDRQEGTLLLLRRARVLASDASLDQAPTRERSAAEAIVKEMDGLPLALDQAGAYIEETRCGISAYLDRYRQQQATLLQRRGRSGKDHPEPVAATWSLSFEQVERRDPVAADLLRFCAFLAPDAIPEELMVESAAELGAHLKRLADDASLLDEAMATLLRFSLLRRQQEDNTLSMHRLVQTVLKASLDDAMRQQWAERTVRAVNHAFPKVEFATWPHCQRLISHAQACADLIRQHRLAFPEAARLLNRAGWYLREHAQYTQAEPLLQQALTIYENSRDAEASEIGSPLNNLGILYQSQGKYTQAEPLYQRALAIDEQELGATHPDTASSLNNLALLYQDQGRYAEAEPLYQRALAIREQELGATHPYTAASLNNLAMLYESQGEYAQAGPLYQRALAICEQELGATHPDTAQSLGNLAGLYRSQGKYAQAEPLYQRALAICEQELGATHPHTATSLNNLAGLYYSQGKYAQAEPLYQRALAIYEQELGATHPFTATSLNELAGLYYSQGKYAQAEPLYQRALAIYEQELGAMHPDTAGSLNDLALLYDTQGKYAQAEPLYQRALAICEQELGPIHPDTATSLNNLAVLYWSQGKYAQAEPLYLRALEIREQELGAMHPDTASSLNDLALLYKSQGKYAQAEPLYLRALAIREQELGATHPHTAQSLNNLAELYRAQGKYAQAEPLYQRALAIYEQALGPDHPSTITVRENYHTLLAELKHERKGWRFWRR